MQGKNEKAVPVQPFDITYGETFTIYDSFEYTRDLELCDFESVRLLSGNVYKFYQTHDVSPRLIGDKALQPSTTYS